MAFGAGPDDADLRAAWQEFCTRLQEAAERVFKDYNPAAPLHRADAFRFLTQNLGQAFDLALETKDTSAAANMCWQLGADEALIVAFDAHDGFWTMSNMGVFFNSMDYLYRPVSYTPSRTKVDADGKVRLILSHDDPGYRNLQSDASTTFGTQLVKRPALARALPAQTAPVTQEQRIAQLRARFDGIRQRHGL